MQCVATAAFCSTNSECVSCMKYIDHHVLHMGISSGISGEKLEIDPVTNQKASTKFWIRQKPISIDSDHLCACDLVEERSPSEWSTETLGHPAHVNTLFMYLNFRYL